MSAIIPNVFRILLDAETLKERAIKTVLSCISHQCADRADGSSPVSREDWLLLRREHLASKAKIAELIVAKERAEEKIIAIHEIRNMMITHGIYVADLAPCVYFQDGTQR